MQKVYLDWKNFPCYPRRGIRFCICCYSFSEGPESAQGGRIGPISPDLGHPELKNRLAQANEGDLIGPFAVGDMHVLLRLDTRITTRLDEALQAQILSELYADWLERQLQLLEVGDSIEPPVHSSLMTASMSSRLGAAGFCSTQPC